MVDRLVTELWCTTVSVTGVVICACDAFNGPLCSRGLLAILGNARTRQRARTAFFQHICSITPRGERRPAAGHCGLFGGQLALAQTQTNTEGL